MDYVDKYVGRILDNRYEILELIGSGGMAYVYKALCHRLNRLVAIKILKEDLALDEEFQRRFYAESQAIAMLSHPNIVAVYDVSRSGNTEYIVMELIEGITLKQYMSRKGLLNWKEALHFGTQIVKALTHAHSRGIIHRDIKPHNIMILKDGSVKVADFGIARLLMYQNTMSQDTLGSVHYISPEQAKGSLIDARSDIYSVGVVMYEMLTSRLPFVGDTAVSVAIQHISAIPLSPRDINPEIPIGLEEITMHAMEPDADTRFATADEMLADLEEFRKNPSVVFNYSMSDHSSRVSADSRTAYQTRIIPKDAITTPSRNVLPVVTPRPKTDLTENEYRDAKRTSRSTGTLIGILAVVVAVLVLVAVFVIPTLSDWFNPPDEKITIPSFIGRYYNDIRLDPDYWDLYEFIPEFVTNSDKPENEIVNQNPPPYTQRSLPLEGERTKITLFISSGDEQPDDMPNLIGDNYIRARNTLLMLNLDLDIVEEQVPDNNLPEGEVFETEPRYGQPLSRGLTVLIKYAVPEGEKTYDIPNLLNQTETAARQLLEDIEGFINIIWDEDYYSDVQAGRIAFMTGGGTTVSAGSTIYIIVSLGPEPTPEPTEDETPTPDPQTPPPPDPQTPDPQTPEPQTPEPQPPDSGDGDGGSGEG